MPTPQYRIQLRNNALTPLGELATGDLIDGDVVGNFNDVGQWALTINADSPMAPYFLAGNGVIISRDRGDGSGAQALTSGPIWHLERQLQANAFVLAGPDDMFWLKARRADPVTTYPYRAAVLALAGILRYYRLGEVSGTTATDAKSAVSGTYTASGVSYAIAPGIDDTDTAVTLNGTSGRISFPTTSLPSGNSAWTIGAWVRLNSTPGGNVYVIGYGANSSLQNPLLYINSSRQAILTAFGAGDCGFQPMNVASWYLLAGTYDGTSLRFYANGVQVGSTTTPGTLTIPASGTTGSIGSNGAGSGNWLPGSVDEAFVCSGALSASAIQSLYALGYSRYANAAYDTRTNTASTVIRGYVNDNAGPNALLARRVPGLALAADPAIGSSVTGNARFDNLLALCQQLALSGGDIGFRLIQTDVGVLTFSVYQPATQSNAIFSQALGNLLDANYTLDGPAANQYVSGGGGQLTARLFVRGDDATSQATWGRVEGFIDARDTTDPATVAQRISAQLSQDAQKTNLTITPVDTPALQYGRDYGLGDIVTVQIDSSTITDKIRQIHIQLNTSDQELVTPGIGTPGAGQVAHLFDARARALAKIQQQLRGLQTAQ